MIGAPFSYTVLPFVPLAAGGAAHSPQRASAGGVSAAGAPSLSEDKLLNKARTPSPHHLKLEHIVKLAVAQMVKAHGVERLGFLTLTFRDHVLCAKEAQRRLNSLLTNVVRGRYTDYICVLERQKSGRIHFHLLVCVGSDIRTGFDHEAVKRRDYRSVCPALRAEWAFWRKTGPAYGFGRIELLPIKDGSAIASYIAKYIGKHVGNRLPQDKGVRLIRMSDGTRPGNCKFSWVQNGAREWREKLGAFAAAVGIADIAEMAPRYGRKWAYRLRDAIIGWNVENTRCWQAERAGGQAASVDLAALIQSLTVYAEAQESNGI